MNYHKLKLVMLFNVIISSTLYFEADPFNLFYYENEQFNQNDNYFSLNIRPAYQDGNNNKLNLTYNAWYYYNDNAPNLENTSDKWVARGSNIFNSVHFDYFNKFIHFSLEPFFFASQNLRFNPQYTDPLFQALNDGLAHEERPYINYGLRETQLILHQKDFGIGLSNTNMWWGPGLHNSLHMSNNTSGFNYFFLGTTSEKRMGLIGCNLKYVFSKLDKNEAKPYFTAIAADITYYSDPIITLGFFRSFLSGGILANENITVGQAMLLPFKSFFKKTLFEENDNEDPSDTIDQTLSFFTSVLLPKYKLKLYCEFGWDDHRWDVYDFAQHPDHSSAKLIGFRKYGLFNRQELILGLEYTDLVTGRYENRGYGSPVWYGRSSYDYHQYNNRRFTAHSGTDSDDLLIYLGYISDNKDLILSFNYERHGVVKSVQISEEEGLFYIPEVKLELKFDARRKFNKNEVYFFYEFEYINSLGIVHQGIDERFDLPGRKANVFGIGFKREIK